MSGDEAVVAPNNGGVTTIELFFDTFVVVTVVLTVLSLVAPFTGDAGTATRVVFELTHLAAAAVVIPTIAGKLRRDTMR